MKKIFYPKDIISDLSVSYIISAKKLKFLRIFMAAYTMVLIASESLEKRYVTITNLKYLTNWGVYLNLVYFILTIFNKKWFLAYIIFEINFSL